MPTKTPVGEPCSDSGQIPARSSASQHNSSTSRCCGSTATASRGLIPKNPASKSPASCSTPPPPPTTPPPPPPATPGPPAAPTPHPAPQPATPTTPPASPHPPGNGNSPTPPQ